jgi:hypothetical protein
MGQADTNQLAISRELNDLRRRVSRLERRQAQPRTIHGGAYTTYDITAGAITIKNTDCNIVIDTESDAASDDLQVINGGTTGQIIIIRSLINVQDPTLKDYVSGSDNLRLAGDFTLSHPYDHIVLIRVDVNDWCEISRSNNQ